MTLLLALWAAGAALMLLAWGGRWLRLRRQDRDFAALVETVLAIDHDPLARRQAFRYRGKIVLGLGHRDDPLLDRIVGLDDEEIAAVGPSLNALRWHGALSAVS